MLLREVGAPRIVSRKRLVAFQEPQVLTDGLVVADRLIGGGSVVKLHKKTLKEIWRKKSDLVLWGASDRLLFFKHAYEIQVWNSDGRLLWKREAMVSPQGDHWLEFVGRQVRVIDPATGEARDGFGLDADWSDLMKWPVGSHVILVTPRAETDPVVAFDVEARRTLWAKNLLPEIRERFGIDCPNLVFVPSGSGRFVGTSGEYAIGLSVQDGNPRWMQPIGLHYNMALVRDGRIYAWSTKGSSATRTTLDMTAGAMTRETTVPATSRNHFVVIDEATGNIVMDRDLAAEGAPFDQFQEPMRPVLCKSHVVFVTQSGGWTVVVRLSDGEPVWRHQFDTDVFPPAFDDNRLYFPCADGTLVVFEAEGEEL